jgi:hypothetical protein
MAEAPPIVMQPPTSAFPYPAGDEPFDFPTTGEPTPRPTVTLPVERPIPPGADPKTVARAYFEATTAGDEEAEMGLLTEQAQQVMAEFREMGMSSGGPSPGSYDIRDVTIDGDEAKVKAIHTDAQTRRPEPGTLMLRREDGEWCVYAIEVAETAEHPAMTINFERTDGILGAFAEFGQEMQELPGAMMEGFLGGEEENPEQVAATFEAIEAVDPERFRLSWSVDLDLAGRPAGEAIAELAAPIGLALDRSGASGGTLERPVTLSAEGLTRLEAIERVCEAAGLYATYGAPPGEGVLGSFEGDAVTPIPGPRPWPVAFAGPFLIEVLGVDQQPTGAGELSIRALGLGLPPGVLKMLEQDMFRMPDDELVAIESVTGLNGENLTSQGQFPSTMSSDGLPEGVYEVERSVPLAGLLRSVSAIAEVRGRLTLEIPTEVRSIRLDTLRPGTVQRSGDLTATIGGQGPSNLSIKLERRLENEGESSWARRVFLLGRNQDGHPIGGEFGAGGGGGHEYTGFLLFDGDPASVTLKFAGTIKKHVEEFRLGPIPLRDSPRMPDAVAALDLSGNEAPVTAEFVRFLDQEDPGFGNSGPPYLVRILNHSNKDVRRLVLEATFLDNAGNPVGQAPPLNLDFQPYLVQKGDEVERKQTGFFIPKGAVSATFRAIEVGFTDGTAWRDPAG